MLPKKNRLTKTVDFKKVFKKGKGFKEEFLFLKILENNLKESRFGFIVSKKISKKSSFRNKIKRKLQELIRFRINKIKKRIDGVVIIYPGFDKENIQKIEWLLDRLFKKAGLF